MVEVYLVVLELEIGGRRGCGLEGAHLLVAAEICKKYVYTSLSHSLHTLTDLAEGSWRRESECVLVGRGRQCVQVRERG